MSCSGYRHAQLWCFAYCHSPAPRRAGQPCCTACCRLFPSAPWPWLESRRASSHICPAEKCPAVAFWGCDSPEDICMSSVRHHSWEQAWPCKEQTRGSPLLIWAITGVDEGYLSNRPFMLQHKLVCRKVQGIIWVSSPWQESVWILQQQFWQLPSCMTEVTSRQSWLAAISKLSPSCCLTAWACCRGKSGPYGYKLPQSPGEPGNPYFDFDGLWTRALHYSSLLMWSNDLTEAVLRHVRQC